MTKHKILMIDDHKLFLAGLCDLVNRERDMEVVGVAECGAEGLALAEALLPDIVVLDISMPGMSGIETAGILTERYRRIKLAALTMHLDIRMISEALKADFRGYILKEASPEEFILALRVIAGGEVYLSPKAATLVIGEYRKILEKTSQGTISARPILSEREKEVLKLLVKGLSTKAIVEELHISKSTVDSHRRNILEKLGCENVTCLTRYALREGLVDLDS